MKSLPDLPKSTEKDLFSAVSNYLRHTTDRLKRRQVDVPQTNISVDIE